MIRRRKKVRKHFPTGKNRFPKGKLCVGIKKKAGVSAF